MWLNKTSHIAVLRSDGDPAAALSERYCMEQPSVELFSAIWIHHFKKVQGLRVQGSRPALCELKHFGVKLRSCPRFTVWEPRTDDGLCCSNLSKVLSHVNPACQASAVGVGGVECRSGGFVQCSISFEAIEHSNFGERLFAWKFVMLSTMIVVRSASMYICAPK